MYGAIIGDLSGSIYEYDQINNIHGLDADELITTNSFYSDDTILTIAILDAILNDKNYDLYLRKYINKYKNYKPNFTPYFKSAFSPNLIKWSNCDEIGKSRGNGAMMRISPVGYMFDHEFDVKQNVILATTPSHYSAEAIKSSMLVALIIYYSRIGLSKNEIINKLNIRYEANQFNKFNTTCDETISNCLYSLFESNSFDESIKTVLKFGGDTDTNACIVGSMAEAMYGINEEEIIKLKEKIPLEFNNILEKGYSKVRRYYR